MEHGKPNSNTDRLSACPSTTSVQILDQHIFHGDLHLEKKERELERSERGVLRTDTVEWLCCRGQTLPSLPSLSLRLPSSYPLNPQTTSASPSLSPSHIWEVLSKTEKCELGSTWIRHHSFSIFLPCGCFFYLLCTV